MASPTPALGEGAVNTKSTIHPTPRRHDEYHARCERSRDDKGWEQLWSELCREEQRTYTFFGATLIFDNFDDAMAARRELIACGFTFDVLPEIGACTPHTTFVEIRRSVPVGLDVNVLCRHLDDIAEPLGGFFDEAGFFPEESERERQLHRLQ
jgi:hypothetical protein